MKRVANGCFITSIVLLLLSACAPVISGDFVLVDSDCRDNPVVISFYKNHCKLFADGVWKRGHFYREHDFIVVKYKGQLRKSLIKANGYHSFTGVRGITGNYLNLRNMDVKTLRCADIYVTITDLNMRSLPKLDAKIRYTFPSGTHLKCFPVSNSDWLLTFHGGGFGYVHRDYMRPVKINQQSSLIRK